LLEYADEQKALLESKRIWSATQKGTKAEAVAKKRMAHVLAKVEELKKKKLHWDEHKDQLANQRAFIKKRIETLPAWGSIALFVSHKASRQADEKTGEVQRRVVVFQDFVSMYCLSGRKVNNLVLSIYSKDEGGAIRIRYLDNFCTDGSKRADTFFVRAVWRHHLKKGGSGEFQGLFFPTPASALPRRDAYSPNRR
jgi:hypothetical protein